MRGNRGTRNNYTSAGYVAYNNTQQQFCPVPPRSNYKIYKPTISSIPINQQEAYQSRPFRPYYSIAEEERQRILAIRKAEEEEKERNRRLLAEHERMMRIREEQSLVNRPTQTRIPVARQPSISLEEMLAEIQRPPPSDNNTSIRRVNESSVNFLNTGFTQVNSTKDKDAEKRKSLYDRNIASVKELAKLNSEEPCSVCYDEDSENMLIMVCCKQFFCFACISAWWKEKKTCPACRISDPVFIEVTGKKAQKEILKIDEEDSITETIPEKQQKETITKVVSEKIIFEPEIILDYENESYSETTEEELKSDSETGEEENLKNSF